MTKILAGQKAPLFTLPDLQGASRSLALALEKGPAVVAFFKISCPVCQFTFPFLERLYNAYKGTKVTFWGVSQDDARDTAEFCEEFEITFPVLLDDERAYEVSNQYALTNVPTFFLILPDGTAKVSSVGFNKGKLEQIDAFLADFTKKTKLPLFMPGEVVPATKPG
jgi:peroxiredoxin